MRRALEELRIEKDASDSRAAKVNHLEDLVVELRQANRSLEDKISRLCEAPFISDAFGQHEARHRLEELINERDSLAGQVAHLQEAVRTNFSALTTLKKQAAQIREERDSFKKSNDELLKKLETAESGASELNDKLKMFSGNDELDVESLEKALTLVKRRSMALDRLPFLENPESDEFVGAPNLKRKIEEIQILNMRLGEDNERLESMLKMQVGINQDLHKELAALVLVRDKEKCDLAKKTTDFEQLSLIRLEKIHKLEAQLRELTYGLGKNLKAKSSAFIENGDTSTIADIDEDNNLISQLLSDKKEIEPDENLLEIWIKRAKFEDGVLPPGSSTFVVVDFFDYESQATPLIGGGKPSWDFAATYKIRIDDFFLRFLATDSVHIDINMVSVREDIVCWIMRYEFLRFIFVGASRRVYFTI